MKRYRLTKTTKILVFILLLAILGGGVFAAVKSGMVSLEKGNKETFQESDNSSSQVVVSNEENNSKQPSSTSKKTEEINLSLDEWVGWKSIIDANGGLETKPGSIYDTLGIKVNLHVINDATQSSNALIKGDLDAAGYTINRVAFLSKKFTDSGVGIVMPYVTNYSNGGDGIIATNDFQTVESMVNAKIGVPQFSEAHSLIVWFVNQSDLSDTDKQKIINGLIFFETPDEVAKAFFAGQLDVAATWQPYLTQASTMTDCHVLFSTATSSKLIMDGIVFRKDFAEANPDIVSKFIDGALQAAELYSTEFAAVREVMPMFNGMGDDDIKNSTMDAALADWNNNMSTLKNEAVSIYTDMCEVWESIGETVNKDLATTLFDTSYINTLSEKYETLTTISTPKVTVTEENKDIIINTEALLTKSATVNFTINTAKFTDSAEASAALDDFIKIAKQLDGAIIQIEGNTDPNPNTDPTDQANVLLSQQRAETVKNYFVMNGIDPNRIITIGNGSSKPVVPNDSDEHRAANRRTDVSFKCIE